MLAMMVALTIWTILQQDAGRMKQCTLVRIGDLYTLLPGKRHRANNSRSHHLERLLILFRRKPWNEACQDTRKLVGQSCPTQQSTASVPVGFNGSSSSQAHPFRWTQP